MPETPRTVQSVSTVSVFIATSFEVASSVPRSSSKYGSNDSGGTASNNSVVSGLKTRYAVICTDSYAVRIMHERD